MKNRLQFNRHFPIFSGETKTIDGVETWISGRDQAKTWLENKIKRTDFIPLIGEPIVLRYLDKEGKKQLILAVGKATGNTIEQTNQREYHIIDSAELSEGVVEANENAAEALAMASAVTKDVANYRIILQNMIGDGGIEMEDGSYFDTDDPSGCGLYKVYPGTNYISGATSLAKADYILDTELGNTNAALNTLSGVVEEKANALSDLSGATQELSGATVSAIADVNGRVDDVEGDLNELDGKVDELSANTKSYLDNMISLSGVGLNPDGTHIHNHDANYIDNAKSLNESDVILDTKLGELSGVTAQFSADTVSAIDAASQAADDKISELSGSVVNNKTNIENLSAGTQSEITAANDRISALSAGTINEINDVDGKVEALSAGTIQLSADTKSAIEAAKSEAHSEMVTLSGNVVNAIAAEDAKIEALSAGTDSRLDTLEAKYIVGEDAIAVDVDGSKTTISLTIKENDKVLSQDYYGLKSTISMEYDSEEKKIYLKGIDDQVISTINAADFIKDGMLDSVSIFTATEEDHREHPELVVGEMYLRLVFNTDAGKADVFISVKKLVDIYTVSATSLNYLTIEGYEIRANVDVEDGLASYNSMEELNAKAERIIAGAGLSHDESGEYPGHDETHYIKNAHSLDEADVLLDAAIYGVEGQIEGLSDRVDNMGSAVTAISQDVQALSSATHTHINNNDIHVTAAEKVSWNDAVVKANSALTKVENLSGAVINNQSNITNLSGAVINLSAGTIGVFNSAKTYADELFGSITVPDITATTSGSGNVFTGVEVSGHNLTFKQDILAATISDLDEAYESATTYADELFSAITVPDIEVLSTGSGNVITEITASGHQITYELGEVFGDVIPLRTFAIASGESYEELSIVEDDMISDALGKIQKQILDNEEATAAGLNDLNEKYAGCLSAISQNAGVRALSASVVNNKNEISELWDEFNYYTHTGDTYNLSGAVMSVSAKTSHVLTVSLNGVEQGKYCPSADTTLDLTAITHVTGADVILSGYSISTGSTEQELTIVATDSTNEAFGKIAKQVLDNEVVTSNALNNLNDRVNVVSGDVISLSAATTAISQNFAGLSAATFELSAATLDLSAVTLTGVTMNGNAATVQNNVADLGAIVTGVSVNGGSPIAPVSGVVTFNISGQTLDSFFDAAEYNSTDKKIYFKHNGTILSASTIDATDFIKDGMVDNVVIDIPSSGAHSGQSCLIITFNEASGKQDIEIPLNDIFDPNNFYSKSDIDNGLSAVTITGITMNSAAVTVSANVADLGAVITAETQLTVVSGGSGNVVSSVAVSGHQITYNKDFNAASQDDLNGIITSGVSKLNHDVVLSLSGETYGTLTTDFSDSAYTVDTYKKYETANALTNLTLGEFLTIVETGANATLSIASSGLPALPANGVKEAHVIIENTGSTDIIITIASDARIKSTSGTAFGIGAGKTGEFNAMITFDGTNYTFYVITT